MPMSICCALAYVSYVEPGTLDNLPSWAADLLTSARVAHLGLLDDARRPRVLPVTYAVVGDAIWSAVDHKPKRVAGTDLARVRWLRRSPPAALTGGRYDGDWSRPAWGQGLGAVAIGPGRGGRIDALARGYPAHPAR